MFQARLAVESGLLLLIAAALSVPVSLLLRLRLTKNRLGQTQSLHPPEEPWVLQPPALTGE